MTHSIFDGRWPSSKTKRTPQKVHPLPSRTKPRVFSSPPKPLLRSVHPPVTQLRAIDLEPVLLRAERLEPKPAATPGWSPVANSPGEYKHVSGACVRAVNNDYLYWRATPQFLSGRATFRDGECDTLEKAFAHALEPAPVERMLYEQNESTGFYVPPAPVAAPQPAGAPVDPYVAAGHPWARVGMRVRLIERRAGDAGSLTPGKEYVVTPPAKGHAHIASYVATCVSVMNDRGKVIGYWDHLEPLPSETPERGEMDPIAECERLGMTFGASKVFDGAWWVRDAGPDSAPVLVAGCDKLSKPDAARAALAAHARLVSR